VVLALEKPTFSTTSRAVFGVVVLVVLIVFLIWWWVFRVHLPSEAEQGDHADRIETTLLPVVEDLQVEYFMDQSGCDNLTYRRGDFVDGASEDCGGSTDSPAEFDRAARADHERIKAALEVSGTPIERLGGRFSSGGHLRDAWFMSTRGAPFATSWSLEYDPAGTRRQGTEEMVTLTSVDGRDNWWFACCAD
jgi:hypothetical protein